MWVAEYQGGGIMEAKKLSQLAEEVIEFGDCSLSYIYYESDSSDFIPRLYRQMQFQAYVIEQINESRKDMELELQHRLIESANIHT